MLGVAAGVCLLTLRLPPIPQRASYHNFVDQCAWLGIRNFGNVVSNMALPSSAFGDWHSYSVSSRRRPLSASV